MSDPDPSSFERRLLLRAGGLSAASGALGALAAGLRLLSPRVRYEAESRFTVGVPRDYPPDSSTLIPEQRLFVVRSRDGFRAISSVCTHLGCNVGSRASGQLVCPCHGSVFDADGRLVEGPARASLTCFRMSLSRRGELLVDRREPVTSDFRFEV